MGILRELLYGDFEVDFGMMRIIPAEMEAGVSSS